MAQSQLVLDVRQPFIDHLDRVGQPVGVPMSAQFDYLSKIKEPFEILSGGYQIIFKNGKWSQITGSAAKKKSFAREDRRGHPSESRGEKKLKRISLKEIARATRRK